MYTDFMLRVVWLKLLRLSNREEIDSMKKQYQVTLISATGKYKPVSCIITREQATNDDLSLDKEVRKTLITLGTQKICNQRLWGKRELTQYGYTKARVREYDKEKIAKENAERYEKIKEEKYASGEWKRPKKDAEKA